MTEPFENLPIDLGSLPKVEEIEFKPIDIKYRTVSLITAAFFLLCSEEEDLH